MKRYVDLDEILLALPKSAAKIIEDWPLADVEEMRHGKWEEPADPITYKCSCCKKWASGETVYHRWLYCPNCGARMDRE